MIFSSAYQSTNTRRPHPGNNSLMADTADGTANGKSKHKQYLSMLINGERKISWPLAEKLADLFPGKSIRDWKNSGPEELKRAFGQLEGEKVA